MNKYKKNLFKYEVAIILLGIFILIMCTIGNTENFEKIIIIYDISVLIIACICSRKNNIIIIFSLFLLLYYIPILKKILFGYRIEPFNYTLIGVNFKNSIIAYSLFCIIFSIGMILFSNKINRKINICKNIKIYNNKILFYMIISIIIIIIMISHKGEFALMGNYGGGNSSTSALNEYVILFFPIAYIYSGKVKKRINLIWICAGLYVVINILYGDRIGIFMLGIMLFLIFLNNKLGYKRIILIMCILGSIFVLIGHIRVGGIKKENKVIENNMGNILVASNQIIELKNEVTVDVREKSIVEYMARIIIPNKYLSELSDPGSYVVHNYKESLGGGLIVSYFYFWFGWSGVILISILVTYIFIKLNEVEKNHTIIFILAIISFFPRWLGYQPIQIIKVPLVAVGLYILISLLNKKELEGVKNEE